MHAAVVHTFSAPPRYETFTDPAAGEGEALATVTAAGLHPILKALAAGKHYGSTTQPPFIPASTGSDGWKTGHVFSSACRGLRLASLLSAAPSTDPPAWRFRIRWKIRRSRP